MILSLLFGFKKILPLLTEFVVLFLVGLKFTSSQTTSMAAVTPVVVAATAKQTATVSRRHNCYPIIVKYN